MCLFPATFPFSSESLGLLEPLLFLDCVGQREMLLVNLNERKVKKKKLLQEEGATGGFVVSPHLASLSGIQRLLLQLWDEEV